MWALKSASGDFIVFWLSYVVRASGQVRDLCPILKYLRRQV